MSRLTTPARRLALALLAAIAAVAAPSTAPAQRADTTPAQVLTGIDVLERDGFAALKGRKVGLIVNQSSIDRQGTHLIELLTKAPGVTVVALFSPEHGLRGTADEKVADGVDEATGLPVYSLYGKTRKPTFEMIKGIDTLVFDIQDIGARFYTYIATMGGAMEVAKEFGLKIVVLDRPNPIRGDWFDGPIQDDEIVGRFTSFRHMPTVHGMTIGELATFFNAHSGRMQDEPGIGAYLEVIRVEGWERSMYFDETGLPWVNPSPNMRSLDQELLYTMVALTEANKIVSVGRGTERPFEFLGAPWMDGDALTANLRARNLPGIWVMRETFMPRKTDVSGRENYPYQFNEEVCQGVRFVVSDRDVLSPVASGIEMLQALLQVGGEKYSIKSLRDLVGAQWVLDELNAGMAPAEIVAEWRARDDFKAFAKARAESLLY